MGAPLVAQPAPGLLPSRARAIVLLQTLSLGWLLVECGVALYAAAAAHSSLLLAFGSDSLVEVLSAIVVMLQFSPVLRITEKHAARAAAVLLFALAGVVGTLSLASLVLRLSPQASRSGIAVSAAALVAMPLLARLKRREARRSGNRALQADAAQSAVCAYLAATTLAGLLLNALVHAPWVDSAAALLCLPFLVKEGRSAWKGRGCGCCSS